MASIELKYNPYTKKVEKCTADGKNLDLESVWGNQDKELGEWALAFIEKVDAHCNDSVYTIDFEGIERDTNFLENAEKEYEKKRSDVKITVKPNRNITPAEKFDELKELFAKMQAETPFEELKRPELTNLFNKAMSSEFEMAVVATMSSGKSTLINAMLGKDLLPARNEATTANLARIHDIDGQNEFKAIAYNKDHKEIETIENASQEDMEKLNNRGNDVNSEDFVSFIELYGDVKGIESSNMQLVLTDTPGPNNSQNPEHQEHTYSLFKEDYKPMILYVLNASQLGTNDDNFLLRHVADAMAEGGRQSQDRFIFALNKADEFDPEKGEQLEAVIQRVKDYLEQHKIFNPRIFPCDARSAKVFRQYLNKEPLTETEEDDILPKHTSIVKREWRHFSDKAPLSIDARKKLNAMLDEAEKEGKDTGSIKQALVYTGIPAIELAVSEYLSKYALPAKLTKGVDSFKQKIINLGLEVDATKKLAENKEAIDKTVEALNQIEKVVSSGQMGTNLANELKSLDLQSEIDNEYNKVRTTFWSTYLDKVNKMKKDNIDASLAEEYAHQIDSVLKELQISFKSTIDSSIQKGISSLAQNQVNKLNDCIKDLVGETTFELSTAAELLGDCSSITVEETLSNYSHDEDVKVGEHWEKNEQKKWYKPWTWFDEKGWTVDDYETVTKVDFKKFIAENVDPEVDAFLKEARSLTKKYASEQQEKLRSFFEKQIKQIESRIKDKVQEKQSVLSDQQKFEKLMEQNQQHLEWLKTFTCELDNIL